MLDHTQDSGPPATLAERLAGRSVLVTGGSGFIGKALIQKLLREVPELRRLYVLLRPGVGVAIQERLHREILDCAEFGPLPPGRAERARAVAGDLSRAGLGLAPPDRRELCAEIDVIIHCAGSVDFDACPRTAMRTNALGPMRLVRLASETHARSVLVHVSTAYVNGLRRGLAGEQPLEPDRSIAAELAGAAAAPFCLDDEIEHALGGPALPGEAAAPEAREEGVRRARRHGWTDTYTLTKAIGEQLVVRERGDIPTAIVRPSIVGSAWSQPVPGWVEGLKVMDPLLLAYGRGRLRWFVGSRDTVLDVVPVDFVVNAIVAAAARLHERGGLHVYQVTSGAENPLRIGEVADYTRAHFARRPIRPDVPDRPFRLLPVGQLRSRVRVGRALWTSVAATSRLVPGSGALRDTAQRRVRSLERLEHYVSLYLPYVTYGCRFDNARTRELLDWLAPADREGFDFDVRRIDWSDYFERIHLAGLRRHVLGEEPASTSMAVAAR